MFCYNILWVNVLAMMFMTSTKSRLVFRRSYNEAFKAVQDIALQYFTCDVSDSASASSLLEAMHEQQKAAFMRPEMNQCLLDPWFREYWPQFVDSKTQNKTVKKDLLLRHPRKFSMQRPLVDPQVSFMIYICFVVFLTNVQFFFLLAKSTKKFSESMFFFILSKLDH